MQIKLYYGSFATLKKLLTFVDIKGKTRVHAQ